MIGLRLMSSLEVTGLVKHFGKVKAVDGLDMKVDKGEFFVLLGPSASGKTTAFRTICGIETPDAGTIKMDNEDKTHSAMRERGVAMVFQTFALYPHLTIYDNLAFPLRTQKIDEKEVKTRIGEISELLRLGHTLERKPGTASGGEQQRIAIGRALIRKPELLLLDEPLTNLDAKLRHDMRAEFKRIHRERGITIVYATPDELEALTMGDRIGVLKDGKMVQVGTPDDLFDNPKNTYVAGMVGSPQMNLIDGVRKGTDTDPTVAVGFGEFGGAKWARSLCDFPSGENLVFGIRPHEIVPLKNASDHEGPTFTSEVHLIEPLGDVVILDLLSGGEKLKMILPEDQAIKYQIGDQLTCGFNLENSHVFTKETATEVR
jgi:multiple sugar transport system ATP-binding protein